MPCRPRRPESLPTDSREPERPTDCGVMISYVSGFLSTPSWWMPDSWANALRPTIALFGWTAKPVRYETRRLALLICSVATRLPPAGTAVGRVRSAMTTSSSEALPARSPRPLIVTSTWRAPAWTAASVLAVARPRSLWQWTLIDRARADALDDLAGELAELAGDGVADGVGDVHGRGAGVDDRLVDAQEEVVVGAARVLGAELDLGVTPERLARVADPVDRGRERLLAAHPQLVDEVDVARSR